MFHRYGSINATMFQRTLWMLPLFVFAAFSLLAQLPTATVLGVVKDTSEAVIPDVILTARNVETGQTRTALSGVNGAYRFTALPVGVYEIRAEHSGVRTEVRTG